MHEIIIIETPKQSTLSQFMLMEYKIQLWDINDNIKKYLLQDKSYAQ